MKKAVVYWITKDRVSIEKIQRRFGLSTYVSVNKETPCIIKDEDWDLLNETAKLGFIKIRIKK